MGFNDYTDAWVRALTRRRRQERASRRPVVRISINDTPIERDREFHRWWKKREWYAGRRICEYCGSAMTLRKNRPNTFTVDHADPSGRHGADDPTNFRRACYTCNNDKGDLTEDEFRRRLGLTRG